MIAAPSRPRVPAVRGQRDVDDLEAHRTVEPGAEEDADEQQDRHDADGPAPHLLARGQPDGDDARDDAGDLERVHPVTTSIRGRWACNATRTGCSGEGLDRQGAWL